MLSAHGSCKAGTRMLAIPLILLVTTLQNPAAAETAFTVNGTPVDRAVVDLYIESRTQAPASAASAEDRQALIRELTDIYLLSTGESATAAESNPRIAAQIELQRRSLIAQTVAMEFLQGVTVTEEEIQEEYMTQALLAPPQQFKTRHILVESQGKAIDLIAQLDDGAEFAQLAIDHSDGPSGPGGGELDWFSPHEMVEPFSDAVAALEDGAYTKEPVQTEFGWHVILREESRDVEPPTLEGSRDKIRQELQQRRFQVHLEELRTAQDQDN